MAHAGADHELLQRAKVMAGHAVVRARAVLTGAAVEVSYLLRSSSRPSRISSRCASSSGIVRAPTSACRPSMSFCRTSGVNSGEPEHLPPCRHRLGELVEEVLDAALAAAEMVEQDLPHDAPAQSRSPGQRLVDIGDADDVLGDEIIDLACQRRLQAIGHMPGHFLAYADGLLAEPRVEFGGALDRRFRGLRAANDLDQRHQVRRIERMADDATLRVQAAIRLNLAHGEAGRARGDDHVGRQQFIELLIQLLLEIDPLGAVFLDEVRGAQQPSAGPA